MIGHSTHDNSTPYQYLKGLLEQIGADSNLRELVFERYHDNEPFYESLSEIELKDALIKAPFSTDQTLVRSLCGANEWAYVVVEIMPLVRKINAKRPAGSKLRVIPIDGMTAEMDLNWPGAGQNVEAKDCKYASTYHATHYALSANREQDTAKQFELKVWSGLKAGEKAIGVYHHGHLIQGLQGCMSFMDDPEHWHSEFAPINWLSIFTKAHPEARSGIKLVMLDEKDYLYPNLQLKFTERQARRTRDELCSRPDTV